ncbi:hypothetical protein LG3211_3395 [Lysobacter gummosus]|nr:hypothetical protein LG3211_3395 [Lysobacter gummosus]
MGAERIPRAFGISGLRIGARRPPPQQSGRRLARVVPAIKRVTHRPLC